EDWDAAVADPRGCAIADAGYRVADIKSERWPASRRNGWPASVGIRRLLATTSILGETRWSAARDGDAAAATALAIRHVRTCGAASVASDLVMGNLLLMAERGDATAPAVIAYALRALARRSADERRLMRLAARWARPRMRKSRRR
ncbi:MAG TPA: hypothetical protein VGU70_04925, partial [Methylobacterium sp.]|nr:hypothetical protein [Methylobacterium sp.]